MNLKKFLLATAATLTFGLTSFAADEADYLHIRTASGWEVLNLTQVDRLTFTGNTMNALDANGATVASYPRETLEMMYFNESTGVEVITDETEGKAFAFDASSASVTMLKDGDFKLYSLDGRMLVNIPEVKAGETINLSALAKGTVIIKSGNNTAKVMMR